MPPPRWHWGKDGSESGPMSDGIDALVMALNHGAENPFEAPARGDFFIGVHTAAPTSTPLTKKDETMEIKHMDIFGGPAHAVGPSAVAALNGHELLELTRWLSEHPGGYVPAQVVEGLLLTARLPAAAFSVDYPDARGEVLTDTELVQFEEYASTRRADGASTTSYSLHTVQRLLYTLREREKQARERFAEKHAHELKQLRDTIDQQKGGSKARSILRAGEGENLITAAWRGRKAIDLILATEDCDVCFTGDDDGPDYCDVHVVDLDAFLGSCKGMKRPAEETAPEATPRSYDEDITRGFIALVQGDGLTGIASIQAGTSLSEVGRLVLQASADGLGGILCSDQAFVVKVFTRDHREPLGDVVIPCSKERGDQYVVGQRVYDAVVLALPTKTADPDESPSFSFTFHGVVNSPPTSAMRPADFTKHVKTDTLDTPEAFHAWILGRCPARGRDVFIRAGLPLVDVGAAVLATARLTGQAVRPDAFDIVVRDNADPSSPPLTAVTIGSHAVRGDLYTVGLRICNAVAEAWKAKAEALLPTDHVIERGFLLIAHVDGHQGYFHVMRGMAVGEVGRNTLHTVANCQAYADAPTKPFIVELAEDDFSRLPIKLDIPARSPWNHQELGSRIVRAMEADRAKAAGPVTKTVTTKALHVTKDGTVSASPEERVARGFCGFVVRNDHRTSYRFWAIKGDSFSAVGAMVLNAVRSSPFQPKWTDLKEPVTLHLFHENNLGGDPIEVTIPVGQWGVDTIGRRVYQGLVERKADAGGTEEAAKPSPTNPTFQGRWKKYSPTRGPRLGDRVRLKNGSWGHVTSYSVAPRFAATTLNVLIAMIAPFQEVAAYVQVEDVEYEEPESEATWVRYGVGAAEPQPRVGDTVRYPGGKDTTFRGEGTVTAVDAQGDPKVRWPQNGEKWPGSGWGSVCHFRQTLEVAMGRRPAVAAGVIPAGTMVSLHETWTRYTDQRGPQKGDVVREMDTSGRAGVVEDLTVDARFVIIRWGDDTYRTFLDRGSVQFARLQYRVSGSVSVPHAKVSVRAEAAPVAP